MEIMIKATLTVQRKRRTVEKCYGFLPDAGLKLLDRSRQRLTQAQAVSILGISDTKFRKDRDNGLFCRGGGEGRKTWYKAMDLYRYWWKQTQGDMDREVAMSKMSEFLRDIGEDKKMQKKIDEVVKSYGTVV